MSKEFIPKTRSQWYKAKDLELVDELPSKVEQVTLAEDVAVTWTSSTGLHYCDIYEQEEEFNGSENITVILNGNEIPYTEDFQEPGPGWLFFENDTKIRVYCFSKYAPADSVASAYLTKEELLIPPKTNIEKYYAYKAGLYYGELPEPKTVDEFILAIDAGWEPAEDDDSATIMPKTRSQWYKAKALDLVEEVPESKLPPKTNIEKYYAYKAGLYDGELPDPKTVDEYYIALDCGWKPASDSEEPAHGNGK